MTHLKSFIKKESGEKEYKLDDIDHPNGWDWKEIDMLVGMGFEPEGDARMVLKIRNHDGMSDITYKIYKTDDDYILLIDDRKHLFKTFNDMLNKIDELGSVEI
jgi:hypothetical protein